jgi:hypothetical protein
MARGWGGALGILTGLGLLAVNCGPVAAGPKHVTSNTQLLLDGTVLSQTGESVALLALIHVQSRVDLSNGTVAVHANVRDDSLAYVATDATPDDPRLARLQSLKEAAQDLKRRITDLRNAIIGLQQELLEVLSHDLYPLVPGLQVDRQRAAELQRRLAELNAELERLQKELAGVYAAIEALIHELQEQQGEIFSRYSAAGAYTVAPSVCSPDGLCERTVTFALLQPDGSRTRFDVRLGLQFSVVGDIVSDEAAVTYEPPPCSVDTPPACP